MVVQIHDFVAPVLSALTALALVGSIVALLVVQGPMPSRKRVAIAMIAAVFVAVAALSAADGGTAINACYGIEEGSAMWWILGCWWLT